MPSSIRPKLVPSVWQLHDLRLAAALMWFHLWEAPIVTDEDAQLFTERGIALVADWLEVVGQRGLVNETQITARAAMFAAKLLKGCVGNGVESVVHEIPYEELCAVAAFLQRLGHAGQGVAVGQA